MKRKKRKTKASAPKFIQIASCIRPDDNGDDWHLFALDAEGHVWRYSFNDDWVSLSVARRSHG